MANGAKLAYVRVSTVEQNEARQVEALTGYGIDRWYIEKISGKSMDRPKLKEMLAYAREGDTIYIHDWSRISRSTKDLLALVDELRERGIHLVSHHEGFDTSTPGGRLMLTVLAAINEFERTNMLERQREGIAVARAAGRHLGRARAERPEGWDEVTALWRDGQLTAVQAMDRLGLKKSTFYKLVREER